MLSSSSLFFQGLAELVAEILISGVSRLERVDANGALKMQLNVFTLQHRLGSLFWRAEDEPKLNAAAAYFSLVDASIPKIAKGIIEGSGFLFSIEQYMAILGKREGKAVPDDAREVLEKAISTRRNEAI